jgi:pimeloyl-ACP methyl ester carboxylesterase
LPEGEQPNPDQTQAAGAPEALTFASGRYVATRLLGEGGQKRVYLGRDTQLHRDIAIAFIKAEGLDEAALDRVQREAQNIASLGAQPNVITIFDVGDEDGRPYTVCEYAPGGALRQELRRADGPLPLARALTIALDVCQGLASAHAHGVLHRDVKPENILFTAEGSAKLGDFGLAIAFGQSRMTAPGTVLGTAAYMPPEQALGSEVDARGDLYSLGCVLYEMVSGRPPFLGDDMISVVSQHINNVPEAPSAHREGLPAALDALIVRLLAKAPHQRPASAVAVLESLSAIAAAPEASKEPKTAVASTPRPAERKPQRTRRRLLVAGAALVGVAGAVIAAGLVFMLRDSGGGDKAAGIIPGATLVAEGYVPKLEPRECPAELTSAPDVRCHDLVVPEDRSKPAGRQIRMLVMVAPSKAKPAGVPTVFIGGPGGTARYPFGGGVLSQPAGSDVRNYGDVVAVGVRGRQFSEPVLTCPEVSGVWRDRLALPDNGPEANKLFLDAAEQCGRRLVREGFDLNAYGQDEIVDDVRDLAIAKGWSRINVQGSFDLARVAVLLAARYPSLVRSVVLDAPYPVDAAYYEDRLSNYNAGWQAFLAACRTDAACEQAFPNLERELPAGYAQLQQDRPLVTVPDPAGGPDVGVLWNGDRLVDIHLLGLATQSNLPNIPAFFSSPPEDSESLSRAGAGYVVLASAPDPSGDPWGANFSAYCEDLDQHVVTGNLAAAETLYPLFRVFARDPLFELCPRWPTKARPGAIGLLETASAVPALIFTGALDPLAPRAYAQRAAKAFTDATVAVFPNLTSGVLANGPPCISALRLAFLHNPQADLDVDGCIAQVPPIAFVGTDRPGTTPTGTPTETPTATETPSETPTATATPTGPTTPAP